MRAGRVFARACCNSRWGSCLAAGRRVRKPDGRSAGLTQVAFGWCTAAGQPTAGFRPAPAPPRGIDRKPARDPATELPSRERSVLSTEACAHGDALRAPPSPPALLISLTFPRRPTQISQIAARTLARRPLWTPPPINTMPHSRSLLLGVAALLLQLGVLAGWCRQGGGR
jgi:hypothetical protein